MGRRATWCRQECRGYLKWLSYMLQWPCPRTHPHHQKTPAPAGGRLRRHEDVLQNVCSKNTIASIPHWDVGPLSSKVMVARLLRRMACETGRISARGKRKTQDWARTAFLAPSPLEKNSHRSTARQRVRAGSLPPRNHAADAACASFIWFASSASWPATWVSAWT